MMATEFPPQVLKDSN